MKIHHLNCGSVRQIEATYEGLPPAHSVNHCLLVETDQDGLVLVDTGLGLGNVRDPGTTLGTAWVEMAQPVLAEQETAVRQIAQLGYSPDDLRHIIVTHLDVDHCGGLPDFPDAQVHVLAAELEAAMAQAPSFRYRPAHWEHGPNWVTYPLEETSDWFGLTAIQPHGLPPEIQLVPLGGHTEGHTGIAVHDGDRWLLHCGDAYYYHRELDAEPQPHPVLDIVQTRSEVHHELRVGTQIQLRALVRDHGDEVSLFSAHDPWELERYTSREDASATLG
ncbi:glyoxylase-like metal-dependent hydrolase (beta-lactamase superfamily II) [Kibdelosporangium banguiense]|uniref:Glyoxylase-like metal-dependent hydrolase (Beta-lactamase superfamily II) n=1 Tax=Kibdelosporangium banguiense TaxID=1365924 RepID=A0ABS4U177_9PSEU|nr:MBL fold metallo-hydrolase [Kibdelosporangium banguiense]MBP2330385.1 glyoxylase-like metal-dependent hydrolase (beta-lactamase superfamily II) [Kibdelosporangium banguiense]